MFNNILKFCKHIICVLHCTIPYAVCFLCCIIQDSLCLCCSLFNKLISLCISSLHNFMLINKFFWGVIRVRHERGADGKVSTSVSAPDGVRVVR